MKFRKKPVVIEAMHLIDGMEHVIIEWAHEGLRPASNSIITRRPGGLDVRTLEGPLIACYGDWIIKGIMGEFYPIKRDVFEATYEKVTE